MATVPQEDLRAPKRAISPLGLTFVAIGGVVGSGWLFGPLFAARAAGPSAIIAWFIGGAMVILAALPFAEVAAMFPVMGGLGRLPQFSHGRVVGMTVGWVAWVGYVTAAPIEVQALLEYASNKPAFTWLFDEGHGTGNNPLSLGGLAAAFMLLGLFTVINSRGVKLFARINTPLTWFKLFVPIVTAIALLTHFEPTNLTAEGFAPQGAAGIFSAVATGGVVFSLLGFRHALDMAGEAERPQRSVPLALIVSILVSTALFALLQLAFVGSLPAANLEQGWAVMSLPRANGPITAVLTALGLTAIANLVLADAVAGPLGAGLVSSASTSRLSVAVSRDGLFPRWIQDFSRRGIPLRSLVMNMFVGMFVLLAFRDGWQEILTFNTGAIVLSFSAGPVTLVALRRQCPDRYRPFRLPNAELLGVAAMMVVGLIVHWTGWDTLSKLAIPIAVGGVIFAVRVWRARGTGRLYDVREALWLVPWFLGLYLLSWAGSFGEGRELVSPVWGSIGSAALAAAIFPLAVALRLPDDESAAYASQDASEIAF